MINTQSQTCGVVHRTKSKRIGDDIRFTRTTCCARLQVFVTYLTEQERRLHSSDSHPFLLLELLRVVESISKMNYYRVSERKVHVFY